MYFLDLGVWVKGFRVCDANSFYHHVRPISSSLLFITYEPYTLQPMAACWQVRAMITHKGSIQTPADLELYSFLQLVFLEKFVQAYKNFIRLINNLIKASESF